ncbi:uncharacterized protein PHA67_006668 [Liasis olivaceus]
MSENPAELGRDREEPPEAALRRTRKGAREPTSTALRCTIQDAQLSLLLRSLDNTATHARKHTHTSVSERNPRRLLQGGGEAAQAGGFPWDLPSFSPLGQAAASFSLVLPRGEDTGRRTGRRFAISQKSTPKRIPGRETKSKAKLQRRRKWGAYCNGPVGRFTHAALLPTRKIRKDADSRSEAPPRYQQTPCTPAGLALLNAGPRGRAFERSPWRPRRVLQPPSRNGRAGRRERG